MVVGLIRLLTLLRYERCRPPLPEPSDEPPTGRASPLLVADGLPVEEMASVTAFAVTDGSEVGGGGTTT